MINKKIFQKKRISRLQFNKIPETPGVYIFWHKRRPLYVGKAINLKNRLKSYFALTLAEKTRRMLKESESLSFIKVSSEIEALLLESTLIKKFQPHYNSSAKDDKNPLYILITIEPLPRVVTARKKEEKTKNLAFFGPFPSANTVRSVLKFLRRMFPFSDHKIGKRPCLYSHIGLCRPCPSFIQNISDPKEKERLTKIYLSNIRYLKEVLSGGFSKVKQSLNKKMEEKSKEQKYEEAAILRDQIQKLNYITQPIMPIASYLENPNLFEDIREDELNYLKKFLSKGMKLKGKLLRIECFDVAHLAGSQPTASMVTFIKGEADKSFYRNFKIRQAKKGNDISALKEVAQRRLKYLAIWGEPDLIVVDGGKGQVGVFSEIFKKTRIPIIGLAKRFDTVVFPKDKKFLEIRIPKGPALNLLQRVRDEAHRFARRYHHRLIKNSLFPV